MMQTMLSKNFTSTAVVVGMMLSLMSSNSTILANDVQNMHYPKTMIQMVDGLSNSIGNYNPTKRDNIYLGKKTRLEREAETLFGVMRNATSEEMAGVNGYINSISKKTGVNFFDLC